MATYVIRYCDFIFSLVQKMSGKLFVMKIVFRGKSLKILFCIFGSQDTDFYTDV